MGYRHPETGQLIDGCLEKLQPGEPFFVLRAQDKLAPALVTLWTRLARLHGCPESKLLEAGDTAYRMESWAEQTGCSKFPD